MTTTIDSPPTPDAPDVRPASDKAPAKPKAMKIDADGMILRMLSGLGISSVAEMARLFDISPQAMNNTRKRSTIPLTYFLKYLEVYKEKHGYSTSLDWIIFGHQTDAAPVSNLLSSETMFFDASWLKILSVDTDKLRYFVSDKTEHTSPGDILLVNIGDTHLRNGLYIFSINGQPSVMSIRVKFDGTVLIDGESVTTDVANGLTCLGRIIWVGGSPR